MVVTSGGAWSITGLVSLATHSGVSPVTGSQKVPSDLRKQSYSTFYFQILQRGFSMGVSTNESFFQKHTVLMRSSTPSGRVFSTRKLSKSFL